MRTYETTSKIILQHSYSNEHTGLFDYRANDALIRDESKRKPNEPTSKSTGETENFLE